MNKLLTSELHQKGVGIKALLSSETSRSQLLELARRLGLHINAICYVDQLRNVHVPTSTKTNYIVNLKEPAHWCGIHINNKKAYWFNSFSELMPIPKEVLQFFKRCGCTMYYDSDKPVQLTSTGYCGEFVLDWLLFMNRRGHSSTDNFEAFLRHLNSTKKDVMSYKIRHLIN